MFMQVALDEGPGPPIKYQYAELGKLYSVVSHLVRCCDVSARCQSSQHVSVCACVTSAAAANVTCRHEIACSIYASPLRYVAYVAQLKPVRDVDVRCSC